MSPTSAIPALISLLVALLTCGYLASRFGNPSDHGRYRSIDGLRGFLAFFVYVHHACVWYFYLGTGDWQSPPSRLYEEFGRSSVILFFMITSFLFVGKLLDAKPNGIDWGKLFLSRILRIMPLYLFAIALMMVVILIDCGGQLRDPIPKLLDDMIRWAGLTIRGAPIVNQYEPTHLVIASVYWTLRVEFVF